MWLAALAGRLAYLAHSASGHAVTWNRPPTDASRCTGDIVCHECGQVLWCRAHDPWRRTGNEAPPDHWGGTRANRSYTTLFENLQRVLRLAEECPAGPVGDAIRRAACELIEADSSPQRSLHQRRMLKSVTYLQRRLAHSVSRTDYPTSLLLKRLAEALRFPDSQ